MSERTPSQPQPDPAAFDLLDRLVANVGSIILGKSELIRLSLVPLLARGHLLLNDVPGVGKTMLARAIARSIAADFRRVQFTPDLLPLDVTGSSIYRQSTEEFEFRPGPVFTGVLLADEINRATPRTQSALLECMAERQVTVDGVTHPLPELFFVIATLNPVEQMGTYPLPEAQLDRFLLQVHLGYPAPEDEVAILEAQQVQQQHPIEELKPVLDAAAVRQLQTEVTRVAVEPNMRRYIVDVVGTTREHAHFQLGGSPRGSLALMRAAQAWALLSHRSYVVPQDVQHLLPHVLGHRLLLHPQAALAGLTIEEALRQRLATVPVPITPTGTANAGADGAGASAGTTPQAAASRSSTAPTVA